MVVHNIVDLSPLYYRHWFRMNSGKAAKLTAEIDGKQIDVSVIYPVLRDIESFRRTIERGGNAVVTSVCFDMPTDRGEEYEGYKKNRKHVLSEQDYANMRLIEEILGNTGANTFRVDNYEADDIINYLVKRTNQKFGFSVIYTGDKDMFVNIGSNVGIRRYKAARGWDSVSKENYEEYMHMEFGCRIPYNAMGLYLVTVGDSADGVKGINRFGKKAFDKLVDYMYSRGFNQWEELGDYDNVGRLLDQLVDYLGAESYRQAKDALTVVRNRVDREEELDKQLCRDGNLDAFRVSTEELRHKEYTKYKMESLIK